MNKIAVIVGAVMIAVALGIALFSLLHSPAESEKLTEITVGEFKAMLWQVIFADVIGTCGIIIMAMGLIIKS